MTQLDMAAMAVLDAGRAHQSEFLRPIVIALDGPSGAGKSTLAVRIAELGGAVHIPMDDFFSAEIPDPCWDTFDYATRLARIFQWERIRAEVLLPLLVGEEARWHGFDFVAGLREDGTYGMLDAWTVRNPAALILLDGAYSSSPPLADLVDLTVYVEAPRAVRRARQAAREEAVWLAAWHARWDGFEDWYFGQICPAATFDFTVCMG